MKSEYFIYGALIISLITLGYGMIGLTVQDPAPSSNYADRQAALTRTTGSTLEGDVQIDLIPKGIIDGKFVVGISANTHSVGMEQFDLNKIAWLETNGKVYAPISSPALKGHHNSGDLIFDLDNSPSKFRIIIGSIPKPDKRVFEWE